MVSKRKKAQVALTYRITKIHRFRIREESFQASSNQFRRSKKGEILQIPCTCILTNELIMRNGALSQISEFLGLRSTLSTFVVQNTPCFGSKSREFMSSLSTDTNTMSRHQRQSSHVHDIKESPLECRQGIQMIRPYQSKFTKLNA